MRTTIGISIPAELKRSGERQARREQRSFSSLISFALARYLREVGAWEGHVSGESEEPSGQRGPA